MTSNSRNTGGGFETLGEATLKVPTKLWFIAGALFLIFVFFRRGINLYTDWLWFQAVGYSQVFSIEFGAKIAIFFAVAIIFALFFLLNIYIARWQVKRNILFFSDEVLVTQRAVTYASWAIALVLAWLVGTAAASNWLTVLEYINQVPFGIVDPIFGNDVSFYVFTFPLMRFVQGWTVIVLFLSLFGAAGIYLLEQRNNLEEGRIVILPHVQLHLSILGALIFLTFAWGHWLDAYDLMYSPRGVVFGASYTDIAVVLPVLRIMMVVAVLCALALIVNIFIRRNAIALTAIFIWLIAGFVLRGVVPGVIQRFVVEPNELAREAPYIEYNIDFTNRAYGLDNMIDVDVPAPGPTSLIDLEGNKTTFQNVRLWDYRPLLQTFKQLQELRLYYAFEDVDFDRYTVNDEYRQVAISVRELDKSELQSQTWVNQKLQFTHGYGVVMNPVNEVSGEGLPTFWIKDLPPQTDQGLEITRPEIYYGERTDDYVFVNTQEREFDYPGTGDESVYSVYQGTGGVRLDSYLKRVAFALRMSDGNIILSDDIDNDSKIMMYRQIKERVGQIAPFLHFDSDPYIAINDEGKLYWILDAYTTSNLYPYSERVGGQFNYIRNSVKTVLDPYNGTVTFYMIDSSDPLAQTYARIFPGIFKPASAIPESLRRHIRYPEDLFTIQSDLYRTYHMQDPNVFYNKEDLWAIPQETFSGNTQAVEPYYVIAQLPGSDIHEFILILPLTPHNKDNLVAWMAGRSDGENYGQLVTYRFPKQELVFGPLQIEARIDQDPTISSQFSLWDQGGSQVIRGNLLVLPVGDSILYVEPIYLQADSGRIPELKRVIVASGERVVMAENLAKGLADLLGQPANAEDRPAQPQPSGTTETIPSAPIDETVRQLIESASAHYDAAQQALQQEDWASYGAELEALEADLDRLMILATDMEEEPVQAE